MAESSTLRHVQETPASHTEGGVEVLKEEGILKRSWHAVLSPFSSTALAALPDTSRRNRDRELRADRIPESYSNDTNGGTARETVVSSSPSSVGLRETLLNVRVPKKMPTAVKVEGKVWFANERSMHVLCLCFYDID